MIRILIFLSLLLPSFSLAEAPPNREAVLAESPTKEACDDQVMGLYTNLKSTSKTRQLSIVQEGIIRAYEACLDAGLDAEKPQIENLGGYAYTVGSRATSKEQQRAAFNTDIDSLFVRTGDLSPALRVEPSEQALTLRDAISRAQQYGFQMGKVLTEREVEALLGRSMEQRPAEIAKLIGSSEEAVRKLQARGLEKVRGLELDKEEIAYYSEMLADNHHPLFPYDTKNSLQDNLAISIISLIVYGFFTLCFYFAWRVAQNLPDFGWSSGSRPTSSSQSSSYSRPKVMYAGR